MANSERYHINLVGAGSASKKAHKTGAGMGRKKAHKGIKVKGKLSMGSPGGGPKGPKPKKP